MYDDRSKDRLKYWELSEGPFENTRDSKFFYEGKNHIEALERLLYSVRDRNMSFALLTGEIGCGKTLTRTVLENKLDPVYFKVVSLENSSFPFRALLQEIINKIKGVNQPERSDADVYALYSEFRFLLIERLAKCSKNLAIIIDEAQQLSEEALLELKNLTNISGERENYISVILVGQPELRQKIKSLPQLDQRVSLRFHLQEFIQEDIKPYIVHRLLKAGGKRMLFPEEMVQKLIYSATGGNPREINRLCKLSMDSAYILGKKVVSEGVVRGVIKDFQVQDGMM